jgi:hypothetical protein
VRSVNHLNAAGKMYPRAWQQIDIFRSSRGLDLPDWPNWCFLPLAAWYAIVSEGGDMPLDRIPDVGRLAAIGTWRYSQGVYRFDPSVYESLRDMVPSGDMPVDVLYRLPEWSVYIETPGTNWFDEQLHGFWAHLEYDINSQKPELRLLLDTESELVVMPIHMGKWTLTEAVDRAMAETARQAARININMPPAPSDALAAQIYGLVSLVLYLCSDEPEIDDEREPGVAPTRPAPKRTKAGWRLFPAKRPRIWSVGNDLGEQLRSAWAGGEGSKKAAHLRRAHWHGFWSGPRDGERRFHYKFLPPLMIGSGSLIEKNET